MKIETARASVAQAVDALGKTYHRPEVAASLFDATIAGQHVLLIGPPGTAKSAITRDFAALTGDEFFARLITKFSDPSEIWGPLSLKALEDDRRARQTDGYAPDAGVWFLDEVFKGSSSILNSLLTALNERRFENDGAWHDLPLQICVGASNEVPRKNSGLGAFADRFLVRHFVDYVDDASAFDSIAWGAKPGVDAKPIKAGALQAIRKTAEKIQASSALKKAVADIRGACRGENVAVSDRRFAQAASLLRAKAAREGRPEMDVEDVDALRNVLWSAPEEIDVCNKIVDSVLPSWIRELSDAHSVLDQARSDLDKAKNLDLAKGIALIKEGKTKVTMLVEEIDERMSRDPSSKTRAKIFLDAADAYQSDVKAAMLKFMEGM